MALGDLYATLAELRSRVGITDASNTTEDAKLTAALTAASRGIEKSTNRQFNTATATARVFYPRDSCVAIVDDFTTITTLKTGTEGTYSTTWSAADYQLEPLNGVVDGESGWPYWHIRAVGGKSFPCYSRRASIELTAAWGWAAVPAPVKEGCLTLAEELYMLKNSPFGVGGYGQFGIIRARENPMVWREIAPYARDVVLVG